LKETKHTSNLPFLLKAGTAVLLVCFLIFAATDRLDSSVNSVRIKVKTRSDNKQLVDKKEIRLMLRKRLGIDVYRANVRQLDLYDLETFLESDERISRAEIFMDKHHNLTIGILQNLPIARVELTGGEDFYLDPDGKRIPINGELVRVPVVTGHVDKYIGDYKKRKDHNLNYVLSVSQRIYEDDFLSALIDQIHVTQDDDIILIPTMGRQQITLGPNENLSDKIYRLKTYYKKGVKNMGLDRFKELNLRYDGQIVGVKNES